MACSWKLNIDSHIAHCVCVRACDIHIFIWLVFVVIIDIDGGGHNFRHRWISNMAWLVGACVQVHLIFDKCTYNGGAKKSCDFWLFASFVFTFCNWILIRSIIMLWFLWELRNTMKYEHSTRKLDFLLHFGASSLVWFIYLPIIAIVASQVSPLWRYKLLLGEWWRKKEHKYIY